MSALLRWRWWAWYVMAWELIGMEQTSQCTTLHMTNRQTLLQFNKINQIWPLTALSILRMRCTSTMSANIRRRVTEERSARAARTIAPRFMEEQGSSANSWEEDFIWSPEGQIQFYYSTLFQKVCKFHCILNNLHQNFWMCNKNTCII